MTPRSSATGGSTNRSFRTSARVLARTSWRRRWGGTLWGRRAAYLSRPSYRVYTNMLGSVGEVMFFQY